MEHPVLLTGGASGVGKAPADLLLKRGHKVISIDVKPFTTSSFEQHHCDLSDPAVLTRPWQICRGRIRRF